MNKRLPLLFAVGLLFLISACKKETIPTATEAPATINKVSVVNLDFDFLSAKSKMQLDNGKQSVSSAVSLRVKKDSAIWISVMPIAGIEAARALITQDSVFILNRLQREYIATDYSFIRNKFNVEISYPQVEALLLGNYLPGGQENKERVLAEAPQQHLRQLYNYLVLDQFIDPEQFKLTRMQVIDPESKNMIDVNYSDFQLVSGVPFAHVTKVEVKETGEPAEVKASLILNHSRVATQAEPLSFPFSVPDSYTHIR